MEEINKRLTAAHCNRSYSDAQKQNLNQTQTPVTQTREIDSHESKGTCRFVIALF